MDDRAGLSISRMAPAKHSDVSLVPQRSRVPRVRVHYHREPAEQYPHQRKLHNIQRDPLMEATKSPGPTPPTRLRLTQRTIAQQAAATETSAQATACRNAHYD